MSAIRILVADDHSILCQCISTLLEGEPDMEVVAVVNDGPETVEQALALNPDVAIVDLTMPHSGLDAIREIHEKCPATRSLALTMHDDADSRRAVLQAGGVGYVAKRGTTDELLHAIREVHNGRPYLGTVTEPVSRPRLTLAATDAADITPDQLSNREQEVLRLLALGHTNREISEQLGLAKKTIDTFRSRIHKKLQVRGRAQLVSYALRHGILPDEA